MGEADIKSLTPERTDAQAAIVFVHGFGGDVAATWGSFPEILKEEARLADWAIYLLGYQSKLAPDIRGIWAGDPGIPTLATYLKTRIVHDVLQDRIAFIAHSMGGLVVQKALVTHDEVRRKASHVLLYGTPSNGLAKASGLLARIIKRQTADMGLQSGFIQGLRDEWRSEFGDRTVSHLAQTRPFEFAAVAGDRDEFVPATSSLEPFAVGDRHVVPGNHLEIVKPAHASSLSVKVAVGTILGDASLFGPWSSARCAVEMGEFQEAIETLEPNKEDLDEPSAVALAIALDRVGRRDEAIHVLRLRSHRGTDAMGTLAGRLKRMWWAAGVESPARRAQELYEQAYELSVQAKEWDQAFYHGINVAFMALVLDGDAHRAAEMADRVLEHCTEIAEPDEWCLATMAEAYLYKREPAEAHEYYKRAVAKQPEPWKMRSMFAQATRAVEALGEERQVEELARIFGQRGA